MEKKTGDGVYRAPAPQPKAEVMPIYARPGDYDPVLRSNFRMDGEGVVIPAALARRLGSWRVV